MLVIIFVIFLSIYLLVSEYWPLVFKLDHQKLNFQFIKSLYVLDRGRSKGTSSEAFEVIIINCEIDFINVFILNFLTSSFCFLSQGGGNGCLWACVLGLGLHTRPGIWWPVIFETQISCWKQTNTVRTFWDTWSASALRYLDLDHWAILFSSIQGNGRSNF